MSSGLQSQFSYSANQAAYATTTATTKFPRVASFKLERVANRVQSNGIQPGVFGPVASLFGETTSAATGQFQGAVESKAWGGLFELLMGSSTSAQQGGGAAYLETFTLADPVGKFRTFQGARPVRAGTKVPATLTGGKITQAEFSCSVGELLTASMTIDGRSWDNTTALDTASYVIPPAGCGVFSWNQMAVKLGTYGAEAAVTGVKGMTASISRGMDTEAYYANAAGVKVEPVLNELAAITGTIQADWLAKATFEDVAATTSTTSLVWEFVSTTAIATTYYWTWRLVIPGIGLEPATQGVDGPSELTNDWAWSWRYDGTNLPKIELLTTDTSVG